MTMAMCICETSGMKQLNRRAALLRLPSGLLGFSAVSAWAQATYPTRPLRVVVPFPPGGLNDTVGRLLADAMQSDLKQTVVVENRPGAAGLIGTQAVAEAAGDGYTLLLTSTSNHVLSPLTQKSARVDPPRDLQAIALALRTVGVLVVSGAVPARTLAEFIALARSTPGAMNYASSGIGSANHVMTERFKALAGINMTHVPYRGSSLLMTALMAGEVQMALLDFGSAELALQSGKARALAQTGTRRHAALAQVPTLTEAGFAGYDPSFWIGLAAPRTTPAAVIERLNAAVNIALNQTAMKARAQALGWTLIGGPPSVMNDIISKETAGFRETAAGLNLERQ
jgi:tripartite-type tricarboxylate transporter receptor subunit TctC